MSSELNSHNQNVSVVCQEFWGDFSGSAVLFFPAEIDNQLISIMGSSDMDVEFDEISTSLAQETLLELGNILIGACSGKIAELLETRISYSPPFAMVDEPLGTALDKLELDDSNHILSLKTDFTFEGRELSGLMLIAGQKSSFAWVKKALERFMAQYD